MLFSRVTWNTPPAIPAELPAFLKTPKSPKMQQPSHVPSSVVQVESQWEKAGKNILLPVFVRTTFGAKHTSTTPLLPLPS